MPNCRLCDGAAREIFRARILGKYDVAYERCAECGSLQTESPYWLNEVYKSHNLGITDTGAALRAIDCQAVVWTAARVLGLPKRASILDFGGGSGLLCRLLRDRGFDARVSDAHAENDFARGFDDGEATYDVSCAFEVAEHLTNPKSEMNMILGRGRQLCIIGTETYTGQGDDWWYLAREEGQHVFFYSEAGMAQLGSAYGFEYLKIANWHLFLKRPYKWHERVLLALLLSHRVRPWLRAYLGLSLSYDRAAADSAMLQHKIRGSFQECPGKSKS